MNASERHTGWRILEFAARIAQEDEKAALPLLIAAANAFPHDNYDRAKIHHALNNLWNALGDDIRFEEQQSLNQNAIDTHARNAADFAWPESEAREPPLKCEGCGAQSPEDSSTQLHLSRINLDAREWGKGLKWLCSLCINNLREAQLKAAHHGQRNRP